MKESITPKMKYKQSMMKISIKYGVTKASIKVNEWSKTIYRWIKNTMEK